MSPNAFLHKFAVLLGAAMIITGIGLAIIALNRLPTLPGVENSALAAVLEPLQSPLAQPPSPLLPPAVVEATSDKMNNAGNERVDNELDSNDKDSHNTKDNNGEEQIAVPKEQLILVLNESLPTDLISATLDLPTSRNIEYHTILETADASESSVANSTVQLNWQEQNGEAIYRQFFAAATRFDTIDLSLRSLHIQRAWQGNTRTFASVAILENTLPALTQILGEAGESVTVYDDMDTLVAATWTQTSTLALVPFDMLQPNLAVYSIDGQTPIENAVKFNAAAYPLVATVYAHLQPGVPSDTISHLSSSLPSSNRNPTKLTVVAMTGVTAMVRLTAAEMDRRGAAWPAEVVGPELAAADITVISNEVPFVPDCETNTSEDNLVFCSKPEYMETLRLSGTDLIGLTGNHQNDYGLEDALTSLEIYAEEDLPVYGGGADKASAMQPLYIEHNGNKLAFLGANSYGPPSAWATDYSPGSAPFDLAIMSATIRNIKETGRAEIVFAELQYQESYDVLPLYEQRIDFSALARAGADIVTGVQSHVPQAVEFVDNNLVLYGLGNLYFDQMWREDTREGLIVKHTIYNGRHISTQILPTLLYEYGQPRWPAIERRAAILDKVFGASAWE